MPLQLKVHFLPELTSPDALANAAVAVIDVLRATTTITHALAAGAIEVIPCLEVEQAETTAKNYPPDTTVCGGERGGLPIPGFQFGNSPTEYTAHSVAGKRVVFTTTNGTKAIMLCQRASRVAMAGFVNLSAVCRWLEPHAEVHLLCAGTRGEITREDVLLAGAMMHRLAAGKRPCTLNDQAILARDAWRACGAMADGGGGGAIDPVKLAAELRNTQGGRNLAAIGLETDIDVAAQVDRFDCVGELDLGSWMIRVRGGSVR